MPPKTPVTVELDEKPVAVRPLIVHVENNTSRPIGLPPVSGFPSGVRLLHADQVAAANVAHLVREHADDLVGMVGFFQQAGIDEDVRAARDERAVRLLPGLNSVPTQYMDALNDVFKPGGKMRIGGQKIVAEDGSIQILGGKLVTTTDRWPGREAIAQLQEPVRIVKADGVKHGPQITVYPDLQDREDGPEAPHYLPQNKDAALAIIRATSSKDALQRWSTQGKGEVPQAAATKLATVSFESPVGRSRG